jgi:hypothetical protein
MSLRPPRRILPVTCGVVAAVCLWSLLTGTAPFATGFKDDIATFRQTYRCVVTELLARVHAHSHPEGSDRFLVLENAYTGRYMQCLYFNHDRQMLCEAASGWWDEKGNGPNFKPKLAAAQILALSRLGFSTDASHGNFQKYLHFRGAPDFSGVADLMLSALYEGYGAGVMTGVRGYAPFAMRERLLPQNRCIPVS